jgi:serine/threonine protein kinase
MEVSLQSFKKRFTYDPVKDLLGKGGFGEVYKAYDNEDHLFVALKIAQGATDDKYNLINEIKRFKKLNHPNIVKHIEAYEVTTGGTDIHGNPIIHHVGILEYADQGTFADLLKKGTNYRQIEELAKDVIDGLAYLHSEGIIHRDLKPTNILLFSGGEKLRAKITDFGIAKRTDATAASTQLVGTVEYMAPEYFTTGNITPASDVWSIGVMLLEALTGSHPFGKTTQGLNNQQIINQILNKDISSAIQPLNAPFKDMITRCLLREVALRPQSAESLKGLSQEGGDAFAEKTKVLGPKTDIQSIEKQEPKWKRWGKALFDFDLSMPKRKKTIAKELVIVLIIALLTVILPLLTLLCVYPFGESKAHKLRTEAYQLYRQIDSLEQYQPFTFSRSYYPWADDDKSYLYTDLGVLYDGTKNNIQSNKLEFDNTLKSIARNSGKYSWESYDKFVSLIKGKIEQDDRNWIIQYQQVIRSIGESHKSVDIVEHFKSINNLSLVMPSPGLPSEQISSIYKFDPDYFPTEINKWASVPGWLDWFFENRANKSDQFMYYLRKNGVTSRKDFIPFLEKVMKNIGESGKFDLRYYNNERERILNEEEEARGLWGLEKYAKTGELFGLALAILLFIFYPLRILVGVILWSVKILRQS